MSSPLPPLLSDLTPEQRAALDGDALFWYAVQVMGYDCFCGTDDFYILAPDRMGLVYSTETWNLFGLAVAWIEARGYATAFQHLPVSTIYEFDAGPIRGGITLQSEGSSYPLAAARWLVEHGDKLAKEDATNEQND